VGARERSDYRQSDEHAEPATEDLSELQSQRLALEEQLAIAAKAGASWDASAPALLVHALLR
jgi:hypothetical protein